MAGASSKNAPRSRKRVEPESSDSNADINSLKRAKDGSAFTRCVECKKDVPVLLIDMHNCSLDSKIKMKMESMVVEKVVEPKKPAEKKKEVKSAPKSKKGKKPTDPNMPKRPPTAFFLFMEDFRKSYKEEHPDNKSVAVVAKEGGERWKSMPEEEKKVYLERASKMKEKYQSAVKKVKAGNDNVEEEQVVEEIEDQNVESEKEE